jgi:RNA polymerase sigma factor for flagellar operon FliA
MALGKKYIDSYLASETIPTTGSLQKKLPCSTHSHSAHSPDTLEDTIDDRNPYSNPEARLTREDTLRNVTKTLNRNERLVVILYYYEELTMKEIGATLGLSESRVSQMHSSIVQRLQNSVSVQDHFGIKKAA